ncbi:hypothetical protein HBI25_147820 [Parastagonospora nodorum]|nr:hypothetical protein HBH49_122790 [Parastagonospora nodorum]KAH4070094.1 hypothetical protein HBH50_093940 [Parastagonospora nodorum]KAH4090659.1 hypothetical protein HBH48_097710 [Parastagonospora nodorum]KAH4209559.1 hypothetical protein HBI95_077310 [Parastagonospora nodorum]KAH4401347.1 hypothetical protein HBH92_224920 [Parastagonospora nodorum]
MSTPTSETEHPGNELRDAEEFDVNGFTLSAPRGYFQAYGSQLPAQNVPSSRLRHIASSTNSIPPLNPSTAPFTIIQRDRTVSGWQETVLRTYLIWNDARKHMCECRKNRQQRMVQYGQPGERVTFQVDLQDREDFGFDLFACGELFRRVYVRYGEDVRRQVVSWNLDGGLA